MTFSFIPFTLQKDTKNSKCINNFVYVLLQSMDNLSFAIENGLTKEEYKTITTKLNRHPNKNEIGVIAAMWSEHCSYKSS